jgi:hypothetical protein
MCLEKWIKEILRLYESGYYFWDALEKVKEKVNAENKKY